MSKKRLLLKNFITGFLSQAIIIIVGLIVPRIVLTSFGSDTNGLINTVSQVFMYMALLEAGISQAATNSLYKPFKDNDQNSVSFVASTAKKQYRKTTIVYGFAVLLMAFVLPFFVKTSNEYWIVFAVVLFEGLTNVISFYFINIWYCILNACGKTYVNNAFNVVSRLACYAIKIVLASLRVNIAIIQICYFGISLLKLLFYYIYFKKRFGWLNLKVDVGKNKLPYKNDFVVTEISSVIFQSTDMIVLSIFVSTMLSSVYSIYNLVFVALSTLLNGVYASLVYLLNQAYISDLEKYKKMHDVFNSFFVGTMTVLMCVTYFLIIPFVKMYTSGVNDIDYINKWYPLLFCLINLLSWCRYPQTNLTGISGNAKKVAICSIVEAAVNLVLSILLVNFFGIIGVLIATLVSLPIKVVYSNYLCEIKIMKRKPFKTILIFSSNFMIFGLTVLLYEILPNFSISNYLEFIEYGVTLTISYFVIVFSINSFIDKDLKVFVLNFFNNSKM